MVSRPPQEGHVDAAATGGRSIELHRHDPAIPEVVEQRQGVERVAPDVHHAHARAGAHRVVHGAGARIGFGLHRHQHRPAEVARQERRRGVPRTEVRGADDQPAPGTEQRPELVVSEASLGTARRRPLAGERLGQAAGIADEGAGHVQLLLERAPRPQRAAQIVAHLAASAGQRQRERHAEHRGAHPQPSFRAEARAGVGQAPPERAAWRQHPARLGFAARHRMAASFFLMAALSMLPRVTLSAFW
jgi:hypothetical protein